VVPADLLVAVVEKAEQRLRIGGIPQLGITCAVEAQHDVLHDAPRDEVTLTAIIAGTDT
jgi:hypothetical protein